ncbi:hypothetical protein [Actinopolyspora erythraea]|uniref:hypothetical protein n=1 Tax=Actinopolyspora erythraea TaxID=414996 RepID=UPI001184BE8C|nr:hypothetical protein [Actinopolyspora erythraea]
MALAEFPEELFVSSDDPNSYSDITALDASFLESPILILLSILSLYSSYCSSDSNFSSPVLPAPCLPLVCSSASAVPVGAAKEVTSSNPTAIDVRLSLINIIQLLFAGDFIPYL